LAEKSRLRVHLDSRVKVKEDKGMGEVIKER